MVYTDPHSYAQISNGDFNGVCLFKHEDSIECRTYDLGFEIDSIVVDFDGNLISSSGIEIESDTTLFDDFINSNQELFNYLLKVKNTQLWSSLEEVITVDLPKQFKSKDALKMTWAIIRKEKITNKDYQGQIDIVPFLLEQGELKRKLTSANECDLSKVELVAGADVAYDEKNGKVVGAIVVLERESLKVIEESVFEGDVAFPYLPGLFSFRETPPLLKAYSQLATKPDVIICDGHGIAHPNGFGMASHLGVELGIPTIGCAKKKLIGFYNGQDLNSERGASIPLIWANKTVGTVLRTQKDTKPVFVSIGHKINLETSEALVLEFAPSFRLPETTRSADQLVNKRIKNLTEPDILTD